MADLQTLEGISHARETLYNKLDTGEIPEARAIAQERVLRGQVDLKATLPLRMASILSKGKSPATNKYLEPLMKRLLVFVGGEKALPEGEKI